jgi:hypothetical protein
VQLAPKNYPCRLIGHKQLNTFCLRASSKNLIIFSTSAGFFAGTFAAAAYLSPTQIAHSKQWVKTYNVILPFGKRL